VAEGVSVRIMDLGDRIKILDLGSFQKVNRAKALHAGAQMFFRLPGVGGAFGVG